MTSLEFGGVIAAAGEVRWMTERAPQWLWNGEPKASDGYRYRVLVKPLRDHALIACTSCRGPRTLEDLGRSTCSSCA